MKKRRGVIILLFGFAVSLLGAYFLAYANSVVETSMHVFTVVCTFLVAAIALPQLAPFLSNSLITRILLPEFYKQSKFWLFLLFQAVLALLSLFIFLNYKAGDVPSLCSRGFTFLLVFDFFYGFYYLDDLRSLLQSPKDMLNSYREKVKKNLEKSLEKGNEYFLSYFENLRKIGMNTMAYDEKVLILDTYDYLLLSFGNMTMPDKKNLRGQMHANLLVKAWEKLVEDLRDSCVLSQEPHSVYNENIVSALKILEISWKLMLKMRIKNLRYKPFIDAVEKLALFSIGRDFQGAAGDAVLLLNTMARGAVPGSLPKEDTQFFVIPLSDIAENFKNIGKEAVKAHVDNITVQCIAILIQHFTMQEEKELIYLLDTLYLMALVWESDLDVLARLGPIPDIFEETEIRTVLEFGEVNYPVETTRIRRFFKDVIKYDNQESLSFVREFKEKFGRFIKKI